MMMFARQMSSQACGKTKMLQTIIENPAGYQAWNMRISSKHHGSRMIPEVKLIHDHSDLTSKVLVTHPEDVRVKVDVYYETLSTIGHIHGIDICKPLVMSYSLLGKNKQILKK